MNPPKEVMDAQRAISEWARNNNLRYWSVGDCSSRELTDRLTEENNHLRDELLAAREQAIKECLAICAKRFAVGCEAEIKALLGNTQASCLQRR